jgi:hypothetical protein
MRRGILIDIASDGEPRPKHEPKGDFGSGIRAQRQPDSGLECAAEPTFAAVALLHLKRMAAICAAEDHLIERLNGGSGPEAAIMLIAVKVRFVRTAADLPAQGE